MNVRIKGICDIILPYWARSLMVKHFSDKEESDSSILSAPTLESVNEERVVTDSYVLLNSLFETTSE